MNNSERGNLVLSVWPPLANMQVVVVAGLAVIMAGLVMEAATVGMRPMLRMSGPALAFVVYVFIFLGPRPIRFFEKGVWFSQPPRTIRMRFVPWDQLQRYSLEGSRLVLNAADPTIGVGPVAGGGYQLRRHDCERVAQVLAKYLPTQP